MGWIVPILGGHRRQFSDFSDRTRHVMHTFHVPHAVLTAVTSLMPLNPLSILWKSFCWLKESILHRTQLVVYAQGHVKATTGKNHLPKGKKGPPWNAIASHKVWFTEGGVFQSPKHRARSPFWLVSCTGQQRGISEKHFRTHLMKENLLQIIFGS